MALKTLEIFLSIARTLKITSIIAWICQLVGIVRETAFSVIWLWFANKMFEIFVKEDFSGIYEKMTWVIQDFSMTSN